MKMLSHKALNDLAALIAIVLVARPIAAHAGAADLFGDIINCAKNQKPKMARNGERAHSN